MFITSVDFSRLVRGVNLLHYVSVIHEENNENTARLCRKYMREEGHKNNQNIVLYALISGQLVEEGGLGRELRDSNGQNNPQLNSLFWYSSDLPICAWAC